MSGFEPCVMRRRSGGWAPHSCAEEGDGAGFVGSVDMGGGGSTGSNTGVCGAFDAVGRPVRAALGAGRRCVITGWTKVDGLRNGAQNFARREWRSVTCQN